MATKPVQRNKPLKLNAKEVNMGLARVANERGRMFFKCIDCEQRCHHRRKLSHKKDCPNRVEKAVK